MKINQLLTGMMLILLLSSCAKKEEFTGLRPDAQLAEVLAAYETQLVGSDEGWIGYLYPAGGGGYTFKFHFDANNRVRMYAAHKSEYAATVQESSYRLRAAQIPSLYFDTYNYLHELADPDPSVVGGQVGEGFLSDFEFSFLGVRADTIRLKGNLNESELILVRATPQQGDDYIQKVYAQKLAMEKMVQFPYYHNILSLGGKTYNMTINTEKSTFSIYGGADVPTRNITYVPTEDGLILQEPFEDGNIRIDALHDVQIDESSHSLSASLADGTPILTNNEASPVQVDVDASARMYGESYQFYAETGIRINGVPDALNLASISGFFGITYYPRRYVDGYDAFFIYWNNGQNYVGPALNTRVQPDGRLLFHNLVGFQNNGTTGLTQENVDVINQWTAMLIDPEGYFVFQTADKAYDLVSIADARIWIRFR